MAAHFGCTITSRSGYCCCCFLSSKQRTASTVCNSSKELLVWASSLLHYKALTIRLELSSVAVMPSFSGECWSCSADCQTGCYFEYDCRVCLEECTLAMLYRLGQVVSHLCGDSSPSMATRMQSTLAAGLRQTEAQRRCDASEAWDRWMTARVSGQPVFANLEVAHQTSFAGQPASEPE